MWQGIEKEGVINMAKRGRKPNQIKKVCKRCGRTEEDSKILSNGYCERCDNIQFGEKEWPKIVPCDITKPPMIWVHEHKPGDPKPMWHKY